MGGRSAAPEARGEASVAAGTRSTMVPPVPVVRSQVVLVEYQMVHGWEMISVSGDPSEMKDELSLRRCH